MPDYQVLLRRSAEKQLDRVPFADHSRVVAKMLALEDNPRPRGSRKLLDEIYRLRIGDFRVIYKIDDQGKQVTVGKIARRREDRYREIEGLF